MKGVLNSPLLLLPFGVVNIEKKLMEGNCYSFVSSVVCCVRFSIDGKYLATGCNRTAQIYDTKTGRKTWCVSAFLSFSVSVSVCLLLSLLRSNFPTHSG